MTNDNPILCEFCPNKATEMWEDAAYCDKCFQKAGERGEYLADLTKEDEALG